MQKQIQKRMLHLSFFWKFYPPPYRNLFWGLASIFHENKKKIDFRLLPHPFFDFSRLIFRKVDFRFSCNLGYFEKSRYELPNLKFVFEICTDKNAFGLTNQCLFGLELGKQIHKFWIFQMLAPKMFVEAGHVL